MKTLAFLTGLRHPDTVEDYDGAYGERVAACIESWGGCQTITDTHTVLVCNRLPFGASGAVLKAMEAAGTLTVIDDVAAAPPELSDREDTLRDKAAKLALATAAAARIARVGMVADCDDWVAPAIAEWVRDNYEPRRLFTVTRGWIYFAETEEMREADGFHRICGTCNAWCLRTVRRRLRRKLESIEDGRRISRVAKQFLARHSKAWRWWPKLAPGGSRLAAPFRGAVYHLGHGDNISLNRTAEMAARHRGRVAHRLGRAPLADTSRVLRYVGASGP